MLETKKPAKPRAKPQKPEAAVGVVAVPEVVAEEIVEVKAVEEMVAVKAAVPPEPPRKSTRKWF